MEIDLLKWNIRHFYNSMIAINGNKHLFLLVPIVNVDVSRRTSQSKAYRLFMKYSERLDGYNYGADIFWNCLVNLGHFIISFEHPVGTEV